MGTMDRNTLHSLLRGIEQQAKAALAEDASFFEALQALKSEIDSDARVRAAVRALRVRGLNVFSSFVPRVHIRIRAGETVLALPQAAAASPSLDGEHFGYVTHIESEVMTQELRDAATAVIAASRHCRELDLILNEAVHARLDFERIASALERAGYELQISLDLSPYTQVRKPYVSPIQAARPNSASSRHPFERQLSTQDMDFLKELRIATDQTRGSSDAGELG